MKNLLQNKKRESISPSHRHLLAFVWKIHQGLRNGTEENVLRSYLSFVWNSELRDHLLNEEVLISSIVKHQNPITDTFFYWHGLLRKKVKLALDPSRKDTKELLENLCILLVELVRHEEKLVKPYLCKYASGEQMTEIDEEEIPAHQSFSPKFWSDN